VCGGRLFCDLASQSGTGKSRRCGWSGARCVYPGLGTTNRCRIRRTKGATTSTVGKATAQDDSHVVNQVPTKPGSIPAAKTVESPEISRDMRHERSRPKAMCSNRVGMKGRMGRNLPFDLKKGERLRWSGGALERAFWRHPRHNAGLQPNGLDDGTGNVQRDQPQHNLGGDLMRLGRHLKAQNPGRGSR
jgi:hypothetical protein